MATAVKIKHPGGIDVLTMVEVTRSEPGPGEVWIEQQAIGVNFLDVMQRQGTAPLATPNGLGLEAAGRVVEMDAGVENVAVGDRVSIHPGTHRAYSSGASISCRPFGEAAGLASYEDAAASALQGHHGAIPH